MRRQVHEVIRIVCGIGDARRQKRDGWVVMNPSRYSHLVELMGSPRRPGRYPWAVVRAAEQRINASGWMKKPPLEITWRDLQGLRREKPWTDPQVQGLLGKRA